MHQKYTPIVEEVEALQITAKNAVTVTQYLHGVPTKHLTGDGRETDEAKDVAGKINRVAVLVPTGDGRQTLAVEGDYITKDAAGAFSVFSAAAFERTHHKVAPKAAKKPVAGKK